MRTFPSFLTFGSWSAVVLKMSWFPPVPARVCRHLADSPAPSSADPLGVPAVQYFQQLRFLTQCYPFWLLCIK